LKGRYCDLGVNYIVHRDNCEGIVKFARTLKEAGVENIRFSPMWTPDFLAYHAPIKPRMEQQLSELQALVDDRFTINSTYDLGSATKNSVRRYTRCLFMQTVPVVGADQIVYAWAICRSSCISAAATNESSSACSTR